MRIRDFRVLLSVALLCALVGTLPVRVNAQIKPQAGLLHPESYHHYFNEFAAQEHEFLNDRPVVNWPWFAANIPWLDVPDKELEQIYYFRWYSFQKHIRQTPDGYVIDEFLDDVPWAGNFNAIDCAAEDHLKEARWLRDAAYADEDARFWLSPDGEPRRYSFAVADSVYSVYLANGDKRLVTGLLPALVSNYEAWENTHQDPNGLFWQIDDRDGMEDSISGNGYRPTISSYMYGDAVAISRIAEMAGQQQVADSYRAKAGRLRAFIETRLWNTHDEFYETVSRHADSGWADVREQIGFIPWYFNIPPPEHDVAWKSLFDPDGFAGKYGPTTAERRSPRFEFKVHHECLWNGPSWPFATTQTLVALANLLNGPEQKVMDNSDYFRLLTTYAYSQHIQTPNGKVIPWIDEDLDADTGTWIARSILIDWGQPPKNRGRYYNHSGFADLIITGLIGLRPESGNEVSIHPLVPRGKWNYFALDGVPYHGHILSLVYDRDGSRYHRGSGFRVLCDGAVIAHAARLQELRVMLPNDTNLGSVATPTAHR